MKNQKVLRMESEINPQLIAVIERDLGINQEESEEQVSQLWTAPPRPVIPFHSVGSDPSVKQPDVAIELYDMYQMAKQLKTGS